MSPLFRGLANRRSPRPKSSISQWFWDHHDEAANKLIRSCREAGFELDGLDVADIGCGDGIISLGVMQRARPRRLVGFDVIPTDVDVLLERARAEGVVREGLPAGLEFRESTSTKTPAGDDEFDFVYSWSAFEHIASPIDVLLEIRRVLRPHGHFFLQLWPFYNSAKGSHLWEWFPEEFHHLLTDGDELARHMQEDDRHPPDWTNRMIREFQHLNRITLDELQRAVLHAGFDVQRIELMTLPTALTPELARYSWTDLAVGGIQLLATRRG